MAGGWQGALWGALFGTISGVASAGAGRGLMLAGIGELGRMAILGAIGASISYGTGGWRGLVSFAAAFAGALAAGGIVKGLQGSNGYELQYKRESPYLEWENGGSSTNSVSPTSSGPYGNREFTVEVYLNRNTLVPQPAAQPRGYLDINLSGGYIVGGTIGFIRDSSMNWYFYVGGGLTSPGVGVNTFYSPGSVNAGWNIGVQGSVGPPYFFGGQGGYGFQNNPAPYGEVGLSISNPSISGSAFYIWDI